MKMKSAGAGAASGCLVWFIAFSMLCMCLLPFSMAIGGVSSTLGAEFVASTLEPYLCPDGTTAEVNEFATTMQDDFGSESATTGYEVNCVDANGNIVQELGPSYAFVWLGVLAVIALALSALLAFVLAAPVGALVSRFMNRRNKASNA
jgi:hypothetical protein